MSRNVEQPCLDGRTPIDAGSFLHFINYHPSVSMMGVADQRPVSDVLCFHALESALVGSKGKKGRVDCRFGLDSLIGTCL